MERIYYKTNISKTLVTIFNSLVFLSGLIVPSTFYTAFALFFALIGVQLHFNVFEDTADTNKLNKYDMYLSIISLVTLLIVFILRSASH